ncbi:hypothetical protein BABINDRAFT_13038 [Babjeviella inositovora NRRL Y-12698]|uniref:Multiple RNA-binding domain-containing protein 1 n=1 Tax=Babjeviella inositovora NRRL Y-12698 TaxID=984486 RepID=A0A1E3QR39_9ASCO|nr:uncharacterized protein BABINDRAFT_13038 [Babjeviella inositovora NRRL Y-12698]ODQ80141.1 hypothetical protein BABINDRAFT_13038 [Babjeviella inositovora NRRL Y-12698]
MSRLIVKGLPQYFSEEDLKKHFSKQGVVTDVKLMKKRNGESRRFAFIGYLKQEDAEKAAKYFDKTFVDTAKIDVELALTFSDPTVPKSFKAKRRMAEDIAWEREQRFASQQEDWEVKRRKQRSGIDDEIQSNPKLKEFMEVMKPSHQVKSWANDDAADGSGAPSSKFLEEHLAAKEGKEILAQSSVDAIADGASDDEYETFKPKTEEEEEEEEMMSLSELPANDESATDTTISDLDWLKQRRMRMSDKTEETESRESFRADTTSEESAPRVPNIHPDRQINHQSLEEQILHRQTRKPEPQPEEEGIVGDEEAKTVRGIAQTGRLFLRNILYTAAEDDFRQLFSKFGALEEVHIAIDTRTGKSKGFCYIQFKNPEEAIQAYYALDKQIFQGRLLHILPGQKKKDHRLDEFDIKNLPLKKQKDLKRKADATKTVFSWNSLYMNNDAVMESVAAKMGVSKADLIDPENSGSAVKQALAEAHVIGDVRKYFEGKGVDLTQFDKSERDDKIILIKNFPYGTTSEEIGELFAPYGEMKRILMPPAGTIAIVEFRDAPSARSAFTKLAFRRFKKSIIYLEKGPKGLFTREPTNNESVDVREEVEEAAKEAKMSVSDVLHNGAEDDADVFEGPTVSIFVKNLNFTTTSLQLTEAFKPLAGFVVAQIKTKPDPKKEGGSLSMGFGFTEFKTKEQANAAIAAMDGHVIDGHKLQLKLSHRQASTSARPTTVSDKKSSKIIIKNLPFEATRKDIQELFGSFGQLKSVRVPKKFDKSARGFAFVEYVLVKEAENAMDSLHGVHLLGRRLVMQFAAQESEDAEVEIAKMTNKVKKQVATQQLAAARLTGKRKIGLEDEEGGDEIDHLYR